MIRVYRFACDAPILREAEVRSQIRAAHDYRNDLTAIERGRRHAMRLMHDTPEIAERAAVLRNAPRKERRDRLRELQRARRLSEKETRCDGGHWAVPEQDADRYPYSPLYERERIALLDASIRRDARALTSAWWGTYLGVEQAADAMRKSDLYDDDGLEPRDPRFLRWTETGQIGAHIQGAPVRTRDALASTGSYVRLVHDEPRGKWATLWLRIGSDGRAPLWTTVRVRVDRQIPDVAKWTWIRLSCRRGGRGRDPGEGAPWEHWSVAITVDDPTPDPRSLDTQSAGVLAVEVAWDMPRDQLIVARWRDDAGRSGDVTMPPRDLEGVRKSASFTAIRAALLEDLRPRLARELRGEGSSLPSWLIGVRDALEVWTDKSIGWRTPSQFRNLYYRWHARERCDAGRRAFEVLDGWEKRDRHLWEYGDGLRGHVLRRRREMYRVMAARWAAQYRTVILDDRVLSREARFGEASDLRFCAAPSELRETIRSAFGADARTYPWRDDAGEEDDRSWCERALDAQIGGSAREGKKPKRVVHGEGGAWAARKARRKSSGANTEGARNVDGKAAE